MILEFTIAIIILLAVSKLFSQGGCRRSVHVNPFCTNVDKRSGKYQDDRKKGFLGIRPFCVDYFGVCEHCEYRKEPKRPAPPKAFAVNK